MRSSSLVFVCFALACNGQTGEQTYDSDKYGPGEFRCDAVEGVEMTFEGQVVHAGSQSPAADVSITLHDDKNKGKTFGETTSAADGSFRLDGTAMVAWDGCLAHAPTDYTLYFTLGSRFTKVSVDHAFGLSWSHSEHLVELNTPVELPE